MIPFHFDSIEFVLSFMWMFDETIYVTGTCMKLVWYKKYEFPSFLQYFNVCFLYKILNMSWNHKWKTATKVQGIRWSENNGCFWWSVLKFKTEPAYDLEIFLEKCSYVVKMRGGWWAGLCMGCLSSLCSDYVIWIVFHILILQLRKLCIVCLLYTSDAADER